jgi:hypothetical protein
MMARKIVQEVMDQPIRLPGCPQFIVTRGWAYAWFRDQVGMDQSKRGPYSLDAIIFGAQSSAEPLSDVVEYEPQLTALAARMAADLAPEVQS